MIEATADFFHRNSSLKREDSQLSAKTFRPPPVWPFFVADGLLVVTAALVIHYSEPGSRPVLLAAALLTLGVLVFIAPYLLGWYAQALASKPPRSGPQRDPAGHAAAEHLENALKKSEEAIAKLTESIAKAEGLAAAPAGTGEDETESARERQHVKQLEELAVRFEKHTEEAKKSEKSHSARLAKLEAAVAGTRERLEDGVTDSSGSVPQSAYITPDKKKNGAADSIPSGDARVEEDSAIIEAGEERSAKAAKAPARPKKSPVKKELDEGLFSTTTLLATAYIGVDNKLFVRGDGPGLSWEKGIPMQFLEIGRWGWTTSEAKEPVRLRLYKNDTEPDPAGDYVLEPESALEVRPEF